MDTALSPDSPLTEDEKVATTVEFLWEVHQKGFQNEMNLRNYLLNKHGLTKTQINEAFQIHQDKLELESKTNSDKLLNSPVEQETASKDDGERPETSTGTNSVPRTLTFLVKENWAEGEKLFVDFLKSENIYCSILECLQFEYYGEMIKMADQRKLDMTQSEVEEIFALVPDLLNFHRSTFFAQLSQGADIAKTFLRFFKTFAGYSDYMKSCILTIKKMRTHSGDKKTVQVDAAHEAKFKT